ncbi:MAG: ribosome silencing factor [Treponema sp. GWB1_62_6]|nr:MAG: ribosome silencing factor [Treponema sp. GWA1_62_8]OHE68286.1 MAG: ribosome silencing factor [Treponema sp. RIFOXYC1_FULL_61_9]OHE69328.1 MAG: ribosome silencing factor [Treponema sp. GWC1_61_84]OHE70737.1 MAG: ribosome silencing factor [Treponema sp. GWB1_62_6]HCM26258.1 ribosome silencing factor [Treponema sp.]
MEDTSFDSSRSAAIALGKMLSEHKGIDAVVLDLTGLNAWTDFFVIATVTSSTHLNGLQRHVKDLAASASLTILRRQRKAASDDEWNLIDMGDIVVHLMTVRSRAFYELERLWSSAPVVWHAEAPQ